MSEKPIHDLPADGLPPLTALDHGKIWVTAGEALQAMKATSGAAEIALHIHALELFCIAMSRAYLELARNQHRRQIGAAPPERAPPAAEPG